MNATVLEKFISYLQFEKSGGLSKNTIDRYLLNLRHFSEQSKKNLLEITTYNEVSEMITGLRKKYGWSPSTTKNAADTASVFYNWAFRMGHIQESPMRLGHEFKNRDRKQMDFFDWSEEDFKKLIYNPNNSTRDNAIFHTLRSSGVRASDLCSFTFKDADLAKRWFFVKDGKGSRDRYAPFDEETKHWLSLYIPAIQRHSNLPWLFQTADFEKLKPHTLYMFVVRKCEKIGISGCPQKFRRSLGGELISRGADLSVVQQILGHKNASTTANHYIGFKKERLQEQYSKYISH